MDSTTCLVALELAKQIMTPEQHAQYVTAMRIAVLKNRINEMTMELEQLEASRKKGIPAQVHHQIVQRLETLNANRRLVAEKLAALN